jgi:hypothetical protein
MPATSLTSPRHIYGHELRVAIVQALSAVPEVRLVAFLQFAGVQQYFIRLLPSTPEAAAAVDAAARGVTAALHPEIATGVQWRVLAPGEPLPSSAVLFRRSP